MNQTFLFPFAVVLFVHLHTWFLFAVIKKRNDFADIAWGLGFVLTSAVALLTLTKWMESPRSILIVVLIGLWGLRLSSYLAIRISRTSEDARYVKMRNDWGESWLVQTYLKVFLLQTFLLGLIAAGPLILIRDFHLQPLTLIDIVFASIAFFGFLIEAIADYQKFIFKSNKDNKGKIIRSGLWKNSRHPNYFGEMLFWFSIAAFSVHNLNDLWWVWISPLILAFFLLKVSGVPLHHLQQNAETEKYLKETHMLWPFSAKK